MNALRNSLIAAAVGVSFGFTSQASGAVDAFLTVNGDQQPSTPVMPGVNVLSWSWGAGNTGSVSVQGPVSATGLLFDASTSAAVTTMSTATGPQKLSITETGLTAASAIPLMSSFTGQLFNSGDALTRTFTITPAGGSPIMLGSVSGDTTTGQVFKMPGSLTGPYSITESILFTAVSPGDSFSIDDSVTTTTPGTPVPEPATLGLLLLGSAAVGFTRRKRKN